MKKVLIAFGSGGHAAQAEKIYEGLMNNYNIELLIEDSDHISEKKYKNAKIYKSIVMRDKKSNFISIFFRSIVGFVEGLDIYLRSKPDVIISTGPGIAFPVSFWGKLFQKKIIFIESWSRVTTKSVAGKFMYYLADHFFVQWPEMKKVYPKAIYKGRLG